MKYVCKQCNEPCTLTFDDEEVVYPPVLCPVDGEKVNWNLDEEEE